MNKKLLVVALAFGCLTHLDARKARKQRTKKQKKVEVCGNDEQRCKNLKDSCYCYCAYKPGPRAKQKDDKPVFIENDPLGNYCYCKQRDIDKVIADHTQELVEG